MHKIFIAQKSHCTCCVLSLATVEEANTKNFILNRTRTGRELFELFAEQCYTSHTDDRVKCVDATLTARPLSCRLSRPPAAKILLSHCRLENRSWAKNKPRKKLRQSRQENHFNVG